MVLLETDFTNLKCDAENNDLVIVKGRLQLTSGVEGVKQAARQRLLLFQGEWMFDLNAGVPYFKDILIKNPNLALVKRRVREQLITVPGIDRAENIESISISLDNANRVATVTWRARTQFGVITDEIRPSFT